MRRSKRVSPPGDWRCLSLRSSSFGRHGIIWGCANGRFQGIYPIALRWGPDICILEKLADLHEPPPNPSPHPEEWRDLGHCVLGASLAALDSHPSESVSRGREKAGGVGELGGWEGSQGRPKPTWSSPGGNPQWDIEPVCVISAPETTGDPLEALTDAVFFSISSLITLIDHLNNTKWTGKVEWCLLPTLPPSLLQSLSRDTCYELTVMLGCGMIFNASVYCWKMLSNENKSYTLG